MMRYTANGSLMIEPFYDVTIVHPITKEQITLNTKKPTQCNCPANMDLYEETFYNLEQLKYNKQGADIVFQSADISNGSLKMNKYYCVPRQFIRQPSKDGGLLMSEPDFPTILCDSNEFAYRGKCVSTKLPRFEAELAACFTAPLDQHDVKCGQGFDVHTAMQTFLAGPTPSATKPNENTVQNHNTYVIENDTPNGIMYCPRSHPFVTQANSYSGNICTNPNTFGLLFNKFCDVSDATQCMFRHTPTRANPTPTPPFAPSFCNNDRFLSTQYVKMWTDALIDNENIASNRSGGRRIN